MEMGRNVSFIITIPKTYRDMLRKIAAQHNMDDPDNVVSAALLGRQILIEYLRSYLDNNEKEGN